MPIPKRKTRSKVQINASVSERVKHYLQREAEIRECSLSELIRNILNDAVKTAQEGSRP